MKQEIINLVEQARNNEERAFTTLYNKYYTTVWFTVYNIVKNRDVTEDLISIVFTKAFKKLDLYTEHISFEMWLKTIAVNSSIDYIRKMKNEKQKREKEKENHPQSSGLSTASWTASRKDQLYGSAKRTGVPWGRLGS